LFFEGYNNEYENFLIEEVGKLNKGEIKREVYGMIVKVLEEDLKRLNLEFWTCFNEL